MHTRSYCISILTVLAAVNLSATYTLESQDTAPKIVSIPFDYDPPSLPWIRVLVKINKDTPLPFIVDTGWGPSLSVARWAADKFGLPKSGRKVSGVEMAEKMVEVPIKQASMGGPPYVGLPLKAVYVDKLDILDSIPASPRIGGICGLPVVSGMPVQIDFVTKTITYYLDKHAPPKPAGAFMLRLHSSDGMQYVTATIGNDKPMDLLLDTGSMGTLLPSEVPESDRLPAEHNSLYGRADGSFELADDIVVKRLKIGEATINELKVKTASNMGILGIDVLSRFRITLDCANSALILEPRYDSHANEGTDPDGWLGAHFRARGKEYYVSYVWPESPASKSGLTPNDVVLELDGKPVESLSQTAVFSVGNGLPGSDVTITYARSGKKSSVKLRRAPRSQAPLNAFIGVDMAKKPDAPFIVNSIRKGCAADAAGLLPGDTITEINGEQTAKMPAYVALDWIDRPSAEVVVLRAGRSEPIRIKVSALAVAK